MSWFPLEQTLWTHRKTYALADDLGIDEVHAGGLVARLWSWSLDNARPDFDQRRGLLTGVVPLAIAGGAGWKGDASAFVASLTRAGFLDQDGDDLVIHDWFDYAGRLLERRRRDRERKRIRAEKARLAANRPARSRGKAIPQESRATGAETARNRIGNVAATVQESLRDSINSTGVNAPLPPTPVVAEPPEARASEPERLRAHPKPKEIERAQVERHALFEPLVTVFGAHACTPSEWRDHCAALESMGAVPEDVPRAAVQYTRIMGADASGRPYVLSPKALVKYWRRCLDTVDEPGPPTSQYDPWEAPAAAFARRYAIGQTDTRTAEERERAIRELEEDTGIHRDYGPSQAAAP